MSGKIRFNLPKGYFAQDELQENGISVKEPVLDNARYNGPGLKFFGYFMLEIPLSISAWYCSSIGTMPKFFLFIVVCSAWIVVMFIFMQLFRWLHFLHVRTKVRKDPYPVAVEPVGTVVKPLFKSASSQRHCCFAVLYRESGSKKPHYYLSAYRRNHPQNVSDTALLYKSRFKDKYYSIDNRFNLVKTQVWKRENNVAESVVANFSEVSSSVGKIKE